MSIIQDKAQLIADQIQNDQAEPKMDFVVILITTIISIIVDAIYLYKTECKQTPQAAATSMRSGGILEKWRLKRIIRKNVNDPQTINQVGAKLLNSTMNVAKTLTDDEVSQMYTETTTPALNSGFNGTKFMEL